MDEETKTTTPTIIVDDNSFIEVVNEADVFGDPAQHISPTPGIISGFIHFLRDAGDVYADARGIPHMRGADIIVTPNVFNLRHADSIGFRFNRYEPKIGWVQENILLSPDKICNPYSAGIADKEKDDKAKEQARLTALKAKENTKRKKLKEKAALLKFAEEQGLTLTKDGKVWDGTGEE